MQRYSPVTSANVPLGQLVHTVAPYETTQSMSEMEKETIAKQERKTNRNIDELTNRARNADLGSVDGIGARLALRT